jgi:hypothetical protein
MNTGAGDGGYADDLTPFMLDVMPRELAPGVWCWTAPHPDWRPDRAVSAAGTATSVHG